MSDQTAVATVFRPGPEIYDAELVPRIFRPWAGRLVEAAGLVAGERVLDVACGTGIVARTAAAKVGPGGTVVGVDINPAMLQLARCRPESAAGRIEYAEGPAERLPLPDLSFDAVFCQQGLQFFEDRLAALKEVHRVLTPRGRALYAVWRGPEYHTALDALDRITLSGHLPPEAMEDSDAPFWLGDLGEIRSLFKRAGFTDVHIRTQVSEVRFPTARQMLNGLLGAHVPAAAATAELSKDAREAMYRDVEQALATYTDDDGVMFPMAGALVRARK